MVCADFNNDGWDDIFVANDQQPNRLWINRQNGTFEDQALLLGVAAFFVRRGGAGTTGPARFQSPSLRTSSGVAA